MGPVEGPAGVPDRRASLEVDRIEGTAGPGLVGPPPPGRAPESTRAGEGELDRVAGALAPVKLLCPPLRLPPAALKEADLIAPAAQLTGDRDSGRARPYDAQIRLDQLVV